MHDEVLNAGRKLKELRGDRSLREIERHTGVSWSQLSKYERGESEPGSSALVALAKFYNVSLDWLLGFTDNPKPIVIPADVSPENKADIIRYIDYIKHREELE